MVKKFLHTEERITSLLVDGDYLWLAFKNGTNSTIKKVSVYNPEIIYFEREIPVDEITSMVLHSTNIIFGVDSESYLGVRVNRVNPLGSLGYFNKPSGVTEKTIDLVLATAVFFLTPGITDNAKVIRFSATSTTYASITELTDVNNAKSITAKNINELWVATYTDPIELIKVFNVSGTTYDFSKFEIK